MPRHASVIRGSYAKLMLPCHALIFSFAYDYFAALMMPLHYFRRHFTIISPFFAAAADAFSPAVCRRQAAAPDAVKMRHDTLRCLPPDATRADVAIIRHVVYARRALHVLMRDGMRASLIIEPREQRARRRAARRCAQCALPRSRAALPFDFAASLSISPFDTPSLLCRLFSPHDTCPLMPPL